MATLSATVDRVGWPRATVTKSGRSLSVVVDEIDGLEPQREVSASEGDRGISSLSPPTVSTARGANALIALAGDAVALAVQSTLGRLPVNEEVILRHKVTVAVAAALDEIDVSV
jgi:hypothetical protein